MQHREARHATPTVYTRFKGSGSWAGCLRVQVLGSSILGLELRGSRTSVCGRLAESW